MKTSQGYAVIAITAAIFGLGMAVQDSYMGFSLFLILSSLNSIGMAYQINQESNNTKEIE